jgi:hypothetical protein
MTTSGLLHPLDIPNNKWESISMDFIVSLPHTQWGHDSIWVVVDRLTKLARFIPTKTTVKAHELVYQFVDELFWFYGLPMDIVMIEILSLLAISGLKSLTSEKLLWAWVPQIILNLMGKLNDWIKLLRICFEPMWLRSLPNGINIFLQQLETYFNGVCFEAGEYVMGVTLGTNV